MMYYGKEFNYDSITGTLYHAYTKGRIKKGTPVTMKLATNGYLYLTVHGVKKMQRRVIWNLVHGIPPKGFILHKNDDPLDLRLENLEEVSIKDTLTRKRPRRDSPTGITGITRKEIKSGYRWTVVINIKGKVKYIGTYQNFQRAIAARRDAERNYYGE